MVTLVAVVVTVSVTVICVSALVIPVMTLIIPVMITMVTVTLVMTVMAFVPGVFLLRCCVHLCVCFWNALLSGLSGLCGEESPFMRKYTHVSQDVLI